MHDNVKCVKIEDFKAENNKVNWKEYKAAQVANGENCRKCDALILSLKGHENECISCSNLLKPERVIHDRLIRCPHCRHEIDPDFEPELFADGNHSVFCENCEKDFEITTHVSFSFMSPPLIDYQGT